MWADWAMKGPTFLISCLGSEVRRRRGVNVALLERNVAETSPPYQVSGDTSGFKYPSWSGSASAVRIARIVKESFELGLENVDPGRTLQQSICYDFSRNRSVSVAWGYSVQLYPSLVTTKSWKRPFRHFKRGGVGLPALYVQHPAHESGAVKGLQPVSLCPALAVHSFNVSAFQLRPESWEKVINLSLYFSLCIINLFTGVDSVAWLARRRQCCEWSTVQMEVESVVQVKIRECSHGRS
ncbi:hypothetical protein CK203_074901 [Vitis vinifera]|uniref:Uncharacterized protein n=1 Tax=Vitis vinifera TaxID=29760 RepID=A0A438DE61_VITVI|nr:hypothetical protein CK203_074901 [Vitis vinifera]